MADRLIFLKWARDAQVSELCLRRHRIYDYEPGCGYITFGNYPTRNPYYPTEEAWKLLDLYAENGVGTVLVFAQWSDHYCGFFGKGPFEAINPKGFRRFIDECHRRNLKVIPYVSPGYLDVRSPVHRSEWSSGTPHLKEVYFDLDKLCPGSPGWRTYFFSGIERIMDDYGCDGLYWDSGFGIGCSNPHGDNHVHFVEFAPFAKGKDKKNWDHVAEAKWMEKETNEGFWALWNEFLCEIYVRVKKRGGFVIAHIGRDMASPFKEKAWDYQLLGEGVPDMSISIDKTKGYEPYIIRFNDWSRLITNWKEKDFTPKLELVPKIANLSMCAIPYLQFPWLHSYLGDEKEDTHNIPGVSWKKEYDVWTEWRKALKKIGRSTIPDLVQPIYFKYLRVYRKMTKPNTVVYMEVKKMKGNSFPLTEGKRRVSVFINDSLWVAIGNLEANSQKVQVKSLQGEDKGKTITLNQGSLTVLSYYDLTSLPEVITFLKE